MKPRWNQVSLGEVLEQDRHYVTELEPKSYKKLSVKLYGRGVVIDTSVNGAEVKMEKHQFAKEGQVIVSEIWAKKGAIGIVPPDGNGALITSHFFIFNVKSELLLPKWIAWVLKGNYLERQLSTVAFGTTGYAAVRPTTFLAAKIPLPPKDEQERIVAHLDAIESRLARARELREVSALESRSLLRSLIDSKHCAGVKSVPMKELVTLRPPDVIVSQSESYTFAGVYSFGRGVFKKEALSGMDFAYDRLTRLRSDDFTYPKLMAWEGALGIVPPDCEGCHVSPEFPVFSVHTSTVLPEVLDVHFKTPAVWRDLAAISPGTNLRRRRLNPNAFLEYQFPLPPMNAQKQLKIIADHESTKHQFLEETVSLEKALLPSLLDRIFNS